MKKYLPLIVVLVVVLIIAGWLVGAYNSFVRLGEEVNTQWAQVENQYQRRADLIPNLVDTVKGVAGFEQSTYVAVTEARSKVGQITVTPETLNDAAAFAKFQNAQEGLTQAISRMLLTVENYPELKASAQFQSLMDELAGTENRIAVERKRFNDTVKTYNIKAKGIPGQWLVSLFGMDNEKLLFESEEGSEDAPDVEFDFAL